jgi:hypothetical protein
MGKSYLKKKLLLTLLSAAILIGTFFIGSKIGASSTWSTEVINQASIDISATGYNKKNELIATDVSGQMKMLLEPKIEEEQAELERLLEEYYKLKLAGLADTDQYKVVEKQIEGITQIIYERYKKELDTAFLNL